ncbi:MAG: Uncharacterized protein G01um101418_697 [Parcubacteria group bacterium Gr01-1014_18]|nr:MAG: Uncharacterized protein Greene041636_849 [Parcubacteria group bacterium Greene0416_36]TSC80278.1 MAG: Uncharacterized protein G01um101418_697 [Parcubacteria group bacterium Gr01-1014_18]TSD07000.1 MAG: Uncharacterized protein Greene07142_457 [Parcubacteria group bacterium Greene0714_2]
MTREGVVASPLSDAKGTSAYRVKRGTEGDLLFNHMLKLLRFLSYLLVFLIPWQARYFWRLGELNGGAWEYGTISIYGWESLALGVIILSVGYWAFSPEWRMRMREVWRGFTKTGLEWPLAFVWLWILAGAGWAVDSDLALYGLGRLELLLCLGFVWVCLSLNPKKIAVCFLLACVLQGYLGMMQFFLQSDIVGENKYLGVSAHDPSELGTSIVDTGLRRWLRAYGTLPHPNIFGGLMAAGLVIAAYWVMDVGRRVTSASRKIFFEMIGAWMSVVIIFSGLMVSFSRSAWIGAGVGISAYFFFLWRAYRKNSEWPVIRLSLLKLCSIVLAMIIVFYLLLAPLFETRFGVEGALEQQSVDTRLDQGREFFAIIKQKGITGVGIGNYTAYLSSFIRSEEPAWTYQPIHNIYLLILAELGLVGLSIIGYFLWKSRICIRQIFKNIFDPADPWTRISISILLGLAVIGLFDHYLWSMAVGWWVALFLLIILRAIKF